MFRRFLFALPFAAIAAAGVLLAIWLGARQESPVPAYRVVVRQDRIDTDDRFIDPLRSHPEVFVDRPKDDTALRERLPPPPKVDPDVARPPPISGKPMTPPRLLSFDGGSLHGNPCEGTLGPKDKFVSGPIVRLPPKYPAIDAEADLVIEFTIGTNGIPTDIAVIESSDSRFNASAIRTAKLWRFRPLCIDGIPRESKRQRIRIEYRLEN